MSETDTKTGFCSNCRAGNHALCASPSCTCPDARRHRNRPGYGAVEGVSNGRQRSTPDKATHAVKPVIELVKEEPPPPEVKLSLVDQVVRAIEDGLPVGNEWFRVVIMPTPRAAKSLATKLTKHVITGREKLEWRAAGVKVFVKGPA